MDFLDDTNRKRLSLGGHANFFQKNLEEGRFLERRMVFRDNNNDPEGPLESEEGLTGDPEIDALLDQFSMKLLYLKEQKRERETFLQRTRSQREVMRQSKESIADLLREIQEGAQLEEEIEGVVDQIDEIETEIQEYEAMAALERFKGKFTEMVPEIMQNNAALVEEALEIFIESQPNFLERLSQDPDLGDDDAFDAAWEIFGELKEGSKDIDEIKAKYDALTQDADALQEQEDEIKEDHRGAVASLYEVDNIYYVLDGVWDEYHTLEIRDVNGELEAEGTNMKDALQMTVITLLEASTAPGQGYAARLDGISEDGPMRMFYDIIGDWTDDMTSEELLESLNIFEGEVLPEIEEGYYADYYGYADHLNETREEKFRVLDEKRSYGWAIKAYEEKDNARRIAAEMFRDVSASTAGFLEDYTAAQSGATPAERLGLEREAAYALAETEALLEELDVPENREFEPTNPSELLAEYEIFVRNQIAFDEVYEKLYGIDSVTADDIAYMVDDIGEDNIYFIPRDTFDGYFNGGTMVNGHIIDDLRGGPGVFFDGKIILTYEPSEGIDVQLMKEVLTHESIHFAMHKEEGAVGALISSILYKGKERDGGGLELALAEQTWGAKMISAFMDTFSGDEFTDWVHARTGSIDTDITFEDVIKDEDIATEVLEEIMTIYMTERAMHGAASKYNKEYLNLMNRFYSSEAGNKLLSRFMPYSETTPHTRKPVVRGYAGDNDAGAAGGETGGEIAVATLGTLEGQLQNIRENLIVSSEELLRELYNVEDHNGIIAGAKEQLGDLTKQLEVFKLQQERGEDINPGQQRRLEKQIKELEETLEKKILGKLRGEKAEREEVPEDEWGYFTRLWKETTFASVDDILKIFSDTWAYLKERRELRRDRVSAEIGKGLAPTQRMRAHFEGLEQAAQNRDVAQWKEKYDDKDPETIDELLKLADDINQVKALFEIKANTNGDFFFRNIEVRKALKRISGRDVVTYAQAKQVFDDIYGTGEADGLERQNSSTRSGKVSESEEMGKQHAKDLGAQWMKMIIDKQDGRWVDSAKFEGFLHYALNAGKSYNRQVVWMIAKGYQLGILDHKTLIEMGGSALIGRSPYIEYLGEIAQAAEDGKKFPGTNITELEYLARMDLFDENGDRTDSSDKANDKQLADWRAFDEWFINHAPNQKGMKERREKLKSSTDNMDHDYIQDIWWDYEIASYDPIFNEQTGARQMIQHPGIANVYGQFLVNSLYWDDGKLEHMFAKWFRVDQLLTEENYEKNSDGSFTMSEDGVERKKKNNRTVLQPTSLDITGAMFKGSSIRDFRNATYQAYKRFAAHGDMAGARDYMMAAMLFYGEGTWLPKSTIKHVYEGNGWGNRFAGIEETTRRMKESMDSGVNPIPDAPVSHTIPFGENNSSMTKDLRGSGINYGQGIRYTP